MSQVIIFQNDNGGVSVCIPTGEISIESVLEKDCPAEAKIVDRSSLPEADNYFFDAWEMDAASVTVNLDKAKNIAHEVRREKRSAEFAPLDIKATIPSEAVAAEAARQAIRDKYAAIQTEIDTAPSVNELKFVLENI
jgi:hypothetical protein